MNGRIETRPSVGRIVFSSIVALIVGALHPFLMIYQVMLPMTIPCISTMVAVALYASAGLIPVVLLAVAALAVSVLGLGPALTVASLPLFAVPAVVVIAGVRKLQPFFRQLRTGMVACVAGVVASVLLAAMFYGTDMMAAMMAKLESIFEVMMPEIWKFYGPTLAASGVEVSYEEFASTFYTVLKVMQQYYVLYLPANLLTGAALTGMIAPLWGNWISARRGNVTAESFKGLHEWFLPSNMTFGILMTLAAGFALSLTSVRGAQTTWHAVSQLAELAFGVQALAANDRRMKENGSTRGRRTFMAVILALFAWIFRLPLLGVTLSAILAVPGCASALFGRRGALRSWVNRNRDDMNGGNG